MVFMTIIPKNVFVLQFIVVQNVAFANVKITVIVLTINVSVPKTMMEHFVKYASAKTVEHVSQINASVLPIFTEIYAKIKCVKIEVPTMIWETANALIYRMEIFVKTAIAKMVELVIQINSSVRKNFQANYAKIFKSKIQNFTKNFQVNFMSKLWDSFL
jgi:hypothetical protein